MLTRKVMDGIKKYWRRRSGWNRFWENQGSHYARVPCHCSFSSEEFVERQEFGFQEVIFRQKKPSLQLHISLDWYSDQKEETDQDFSKGAIERSCPWYVATTEEPRPFWSWEALNRIMACIDDQCKNWSKHHKWWEISRSSGDSSNGSDISFLYNSHHCKPSRKHEKQHSYNNKTDTGTTPHDEKDEQDRYFLLRWTHLQLHFQVAHWWAWLIIQTKRGQAIYG